MRHQPGLIVLLALLTALPGVPPAAAQERNTAAGDFFDDSPPIPSVSRMSRPLLESTARPDPILWEAEGETDVISWLDSSNDVPAARRPDLRYAYPVSSGLSLEIIGQNRLEEFEDYDTENLRERIYYVRLSDGF